MKLTLEKHLLNNTKFFHKVTFKNTDCFKFLDDQIIYVEILSGKKSITKALTIAFG